ncbi:MAG: BON domain-containing protein [Gallionella sp.]|jgi:osmotically-inducible protein OsmY
MIFTTVNKRFTPFILALGLTTMVGCASKETPEDRREAIADGDITSKVQAALSGEPSLNSSEIKVETSQGIVLLTGFVNSETAENTATELARYVHGVMLVRDAIKIK